MENSSYTERLAEYCATIRYEEIPEQVRERAKHVMLDGLGCGLFGARLPWSVILTDTVRGMSSSGPSVVWGTDLKMTPHDAALVNGSYIQAFEIDDGHVGAAIHECAVVLPSALACADLAGPVSGADLLAAIVAGFEVGARMGLCLGAALMLERGWHSGSVYGPHAAAAAGGRVLGLTPNQMAHAFGIAATQASGLMATQFGSMVKRMNHGRASQSGVYSAALAKNGYTGIERVFEERYGGYCTTFTGTTDRFDLNQLTDELGSRFETSQIMIKPYACNGGIHTSIAAVRAIQERRPFTGDDVRRITVRCSKSTWEHVGWEYKPTSITTAQMNMSYSLAALIERGDVFVDEFTEELIRSPRLLDLARRIVPEDDPDINALGSRKRHRVVVTIDFADGTSETEVVEHAPGWPARPLSNEQIAAKYDRLAQKALDQRQTAELKSLVLRLEELPDCRVLAGVLGTGR